MHSLWGLTEKDLLKLSRVRAILITHMHGDHIHGLPGLISTVQLVQMHGPDFKIRLIAPLGMRDYLARVIDFDIEQLDITELEPEKEASGSLFEGVEWHAFPVVHSPEVHAYSYVISEPQKERGLDAARARALGASGKQLGVLKSGHDVTLDDGRVVRCEDCLLPAVPPRRLVFMGDNLRVNEEFIEPFTACADGCSLLVDECTFPEELLAKCDKHSCPSIVGALALRVHAKSLAVTHFSQRITHDEAEAGGCTPERLVEQLREYISAHCSDSGMTEDDVKNMPIAAAEDYLELTVPKQK